MRISEMNWMMVEEYLRRDDRALLPLGCTEQHAYLSLSTDSILAERLAVEAAAPSGVPVFPVLAYGITPYFRAFQGTITLRVKTYLSVIGDILDAIAEQGFKRVLIVNGHGGNTPAQGFIGEWVAEHPGVLCDPFADESLRGRVAAMTIDDQDALEPLLGDCIENISDHRQVRFYPKRDRSLKGTKIRRNAIGQDWKHRNS